MPVATGVILIVLAAGGLLVARAKATLGWACFAMFLTSGLGILVWGLWSPSGNVLRNCGHIAAALGLGWSMFVWVARRVCAEHGRLIAKHPSILAGQFLCLATCVFAVLVCAYFMVAQLAVAVVQTWSFTIIDRSQWFYTDMWGLADLLAVAGASIVMTHATRSSVLVVPLFWALFGGLIWQCLLIPPVIPELDSASVSGLTGVPTIWVLAVLLSSAVLLGALVVIQSLSWQSSRRNAWLEDVSYLLRAPRTWPGLLPTAGGVGLFVLLLGCILLVFPTPADSFRSALPSLIVTLSAGIAAVSVSVVLNRDWRVSLGETALGLYTLSFCSLVMIFVPHDPVQLVDRFPLIFNALVFALAICCMFWMWLARVWQQQLLPGETPWTTTGRMVPLAWRTSLLAGTLGALFALQMSIWPLLPQIRRDDNTFSRWFWGLACIGLLVAAVVRGYRKSRKAEFRPLIIITTFFLFLFVGARLLPYTQYNY